ncbi:uncharacterized protein J3D65DRAFT_676874 [Phyllosticta citribraziliensis]|uniref:Retrotransposon gag domain-containing protein n=1 Tax=Phyllosticta citribraziliensis TaxID=989973 RepID=A0ABR1LPY1_9PEZI
MPTSQASHPESDSDSDEPVIPTPSGGSSEAAPTETASPPELVPRVLVDMLLFSNRLLSRSTNQLVNNVDLFTKNTATRQATGVAECKSETKRLREKFDALSERLAALEAERDQFQTRSPNMLNVLVEARRQEFRPKKVGFFDPDLGVQEYGAGKAVCNRGVMYYRDVDLFIDAVYAVPRRISVSEVRVNLHLCLLGSARTWYASVLTRELRNQAVTGEGISIWADLLRKRWGKPTGIFDRRERFTDLEKPRFSRLHVSSVGASITDFVVAAVEAARRIGMTSTYPQLVLAYLRMEPDVQDDLGPPYEYDTVNSYITRAVQLVKPLPDFSRPYYGTPLGRFVIR